MLIHSLAALLVWGFVVYTAEIAYEEVPATPGSPSRYEPAAGVDYGPERSVGMAILLELLSIAAMAMLLASKVRPLRLSLGSGVAFLLGSANTLRLIPEYPFDPLPSWPRVVLVNAAIAAALAAYLHAWKAEETPE